MLAFFIAQRCQLASAAYRQHFKLFSRRALSSLRTRVRVYKSFVLPVLLYNVATLALTETLEHKLDVFHRKQLRHVVGVRWPATISNEKLYKITDSAPLSHVALQRRWTFFGHVCRLQDDTPAKRAMFAFFRALDCLPRRAGRPCNCLVTTLQRDLRNSNAASYLTLENTSGLLRLIQLAADRKGWKKMVLDRICA